MKARIQKGHIVRIRSNSQKEVFTRSAVVIATIPKIKVVPLRTSKLHRSDLHTVMLEKSDSELARKVSADCGKVMPVDKNEIIGQPLAQLDVQKLERIIKKVQ